MKFQAIKGVRDILPPESALWNRVEQTAREVFATYGYGEIRLPVFEETELFRRSVGVETDIVSKEMYTFPDAPRQYLGWVADMISARRFDYGEDLRLQSYLQSIDFFLYEVNRAFEVGEIPRTSENFKLIEQLVLERKNWDTREVPGAKSPAQQRWYLLQHNVWRLLRSFDFGSFLTLRPEATASVCRAYIEHGMHTWPGNVKLYYIGPMFRRERPQKGRYRQFYQIGAEVLGQSDAPGIDAEVIEMLMHFFEKAGLGKSAAEQAPPPEGGSKLPHSKVAAEDPATGCTLYINSIGCKECRPKYVAELKAALEKVRDQLGPDSQRRIETNPLRVLDSKLPEEQPIIEKLPRITEHLCAACREHYAEVRKQLALRGVAYQENWRLVRGLDYYMRTTFEITAPGLGSQNAVCGGGRYDGLVELLGGPPTKGIGFAIGTDRLVMSLSINLAAAVRGTATVSAALTTEIRLAAAVSGVGTGAAPVLDVFIAWMGAAAQPEAVKIARKLRDAGLSVEVPAEEMKFKKSIGLADKLGARYALIIGENELKEGKYALKRLSDGMQEKVGAEELVAKVSRK